MSPAPVLPGAEPSSSAGGPHGVLVLHGFTGTPQSMRGLAEAFAREGFAVELPLLPGHGTSVEDMAATTWADWSQAAEAAYEDLSARSDRVVVAGLSMGGTLAIWLATRHPDIAGIVLVNPGVVAPDEMRIALQALLDGDTEIMPGVGNDIADPAQTELAYSEAPVRPLLSLLDALDDLDANLGAIKSPMLVMTSPQDHVVPPGASEHLARSVTVPTELVNLERSYHVATLDYDKDQIERRAIEFARRVTNTA